MSELSFSELVDRVIAAERPILLTHTRPDGDTVGSCAALASLFDAMGRSPIVVSPDPIPRRLAFLTEGGWFAPVKEYPADATVIAVDVASPQQLGSLQSVFSGALAPSFMIDHHERGVAFAPRYLRADAAAVGEIVYDLALELVNRGVLPAIPPAAVNAVFASISSDSGCFKYSNVTPRTHRTAASLIELGADAPEINRLLFDVKSAECLSAEGYVASHVLSTPDGKIAWVLVTDAIRDQLGLLDEQFETAIDVVRSLEGVEIAMTVKESPDGKYKVSLRSTGLDVAKVAATLGGGGHARAAGCSLSTDTAEEAAAITVKAVLDAMGA